MHFTLNISKGCFVAGYEPGRSGAVYHESVVRPSGSITVTPRPPALGQRKISSLHRAIEVSSGWEDFGICVWQVSVAR